MDQKTENPECRAIYPRSQVVRALPHLEASSSDFNPTSGPLTMQIVHLAGFLIISEIT